MDLLGSWEKIKLKTKLIEDKKGPIRNMKWTPQPGAHGVGESGAPRPGAHGTGADWATGRGLEQQGREELGHRSGAHGDVVDQGRLDLRAGRSGPPRPGAHAPVESDPGGGEKGVVPGLGRRRRSSCEGRAADGEES
jgi:hypothetical protein